jgi:hypothetical protein
MVIGFFHHVVAGFAAKTKLKRPRMNIVLLVFSVNIHVSWYIDLLSYFIHFSVNVFLFVCIITTYVVLTNEKFQFNVDHVECLRNKENDNSRLYQENWFCGEECVRVC